MPPSRARTIALMLVVLSIVAPVRGTAVAQGTSRVAAAASLNLALPEIAEAFRQDRGERVELVFGASGTLARQIHDGAPFEVFLSADEDFPHRLSTAGLTRDDGSVYALGRLAIFAPAGSPLEVDARLEGLAKLVRAGRVARFAIANPALAPYGRAAESVLRRHGIWEGLRQALVLGDTVAQAAQFATTGNAVGGLLAYSLVKNPALARRGAFALIDASEHEPLRHRMVLLRRARPTAEHFYEYMLGPRARQILQQHGFGTPE